MAGFTAQTSERSIKAIVNAGKLDSAVLNSDAIKDLDWSSKLIHLIKSNLVEEEQLLKVFSKAASLPKAFPKEEEINESAVTALPIRFLIENTILPYQFEDNFLKVLIVDPRNIELKNELKNHTHYELLFEMTTLSHFESLMSNPKISGYLKKFTSQNSFANTNQKTSTNQVKKKALREKWNVNDPDLVMEFCNQILTQAIQEKASDIHIESFRTFANVRMRKDGVMQIVDFYGPYLFKNYAAVTTRFKILADCDIAERRLPQDGAITFKLEGGQEIDFRFNTLPTKNGERLVMRILAGDSVLSLDQIGFDKVDYEKVKDAIHAPQGMVLVTGPTGSGKTTTLYAALKEINRPDINILTAEDPVEYYLEGAGQVEANEKIGLSFSAILRSFLRQDPEVILVGEIRDQETIDIAIKAALTGHLLFSTLHTNDAIATVSRILNMGVPNFMISSAVSLIIAQRLDRKNCELCLEDDPKAKPEILIKLGFKEEELPHVHPKHGAGCEKCNGKGLAGRRGIYEVLRITDALEEAILKSEQAPALLAAAKKDGFKTMQETGRELIREGILSIEEFQANLNIEIN